MRNSNPLLKHTVTNQTILSTSTLSMMLTPSDLTQMKEQRLKTSTRDNKHGSQEKVKLISSYLKSRYKLRRTESDLESSSRTMMFLERVACLSPNSEVSSMLRRSSSQMRNTSSLRINSEFPVTLLKSIMLILTMISKGSLQRRTSRRTQLRD